MNRQELYIHIGYPKTGTTLLQKKIFPKIEDINYVGKSYKDNGLMDRYSEEFKIPLDVVNSLIRNNKKTIDNNSIIEGEKILLSEESILFSTLRPNKSTKESYEVISNTSIIKNIKESFPESKYNINIIISLRRHLDLIISMYVESFYHHYRRCEKLDSIKKFIIEIIEEDTSLHESLDYYNTINLYKESFGKDNVHILLYESILNPSSFISQLGEILKLNINNIDKSIFEKKIHTRTTEEKDIRISNYDTFYDMFGKFKLKTIANIFLPNFVLNYLKKIAVKGKIKINTYITDDDKKKIINSFKESYIKLEKEFNIDLKSLKYYE